MFNRVLIITGPTASGKTLLSEMIASKLPCEIINADVGQFYKQLSVGTAKPDLKNVKYKHHLFDILDKPQDLSVVKYRKLVIDLVADICSRDKVPVIVGGSQFYIKSLFFMPHKTSEQELKIQSVDEKIKIEQINLDKLSADQLWQLLNSIDPVRAEKLHPNDVYRVMRALQIWQKTGLKPSELKPEFNTPFNALIIYVDPERELLKERIRQRTIQMIEPGRLPHEPYIQESRIPESWIQEAQNLIGTEWEEFLKIKNLIGYTEIFDWIKAGKNKNELPTLIEKIQIKTIQYSKRQKTFWKSFEREIIQVSNQAKSVQANIVQTMSVGLPDDLTLNQALMTWHKLTNK